MQKLLVWDVPLLTEILGQTDLAGEKSPIFHLFSPLALQLTPSEKVRLTLIGSPLYALSNEPKMYIVRYP